eukprot:CAMPEP_0119280158 /NCGR_PEP_ID=MMETSP1329-20130426/22151_1 /TAXON_ID=114041 /ORGANISM="Genus nov. species nov., Strain RCC1024" /LENGTH=71 /DNA_ID=CAMNT_0007280733 /DNA_START=85 /DNA_END=297 /DNA_ORIENTATION=-
MSDAYKPHDIEACRNKIGLLPGGTGKLAQYVMASADGSFSLCYCDAPDGYARAAAEREEAAARAEKSPRTP